MKETAPVVDVVYDYDDVENLAENRIAWRRYRVALEDFMTISGERSWDDPVTFSHIRIWLEDDSPEAPTQRVFVIAGFKFVDYE